MFTHFEGVKQYYCNMANHMCGVAEYCTLGDSLACRDLDVGGASCDARVRVSRRA